MDIIAQKIRGQILGHLLRKQAELWEKTDFENFQHNGDFIDFDLQLEALQYEFKKIEEEINEYKLLDYCKENEIDISISFVFPKICKQEDNFYYQPQF